MPLDQCVERGDRDADGAAPALPLPSRRPVGGTQECLRRGRDSRVVEIDPEIKQSRAARNCERLDDHGRIKTIKKLQRPRQSRLRLDRYDPRAQAAKSADAVANMRSDIENEIAGLDETPV